MFCLTVHCCFVYRVKGKNWASWEANMLEQILAHFYIANILLTPMVWFAFWQLNPVPLLMVFYSPRLYKKKNDQKIRSSYFILYIKYWWITFPCFPPFLSISKIAVIVYHVTSLYSAYDYIIAGYGISWHVFERPWRVFCFIYGNTAVLPLSSIFRHFPKNQEKSSKKLRSPNFFLLPWPTQKWS